MSVKNNLQTIREQRGIAAAQLARDVGVSRPTIYAIEAGVYTPNTHIALELARVLECRVEDLFSLEVEPANPPSEIRVKFLSPDTQPREGPTAATLPDWGNRCRSPNSERIKLYPRRRRHRIAGWSKGLQRLCQPTCRAEFGETHCRGRLRSCHIHSRRSTGSLGL